MKFVQSCCIILISLTLMSCLPGKKKEERAIEKAVLATQQVEAEKTAADMINAAEALMSSPDMALTDTKNLKTLRCANGRVAAFVPTSSKLAKDGTIAPIVAQRIRDQLQTQFPASAVVDAAAVTGCGGDPQIVAVNAPVLIVENVLANLAEMKEDSSEIVSVDMQPCGSVDNKRVPGVVVTKTFRNGSTSVEQRCGAAAPREEDMPNIELTEGTMTNWKAQLTGTGADPYVNFTCIAGSDGCTPIKPNSSTKIICPDAPEKREMIANPIFDRSTYQFIPEAAQRDCGKGWSGELVARVKKKTCQVIRNGVAEEEPASVYDIAYVGAKCHKENVLVEDTCPAGLPFSDTGKIFSGVDMIMTDPIALQPLQSSSRSTKNSSVIAYSSTSSGTNADAETVALTQSSVMVQYPDTQKPAHLFFSRINLGQVTVDRTQASPFSGFDKAFTKELMDLNKVNMIAKDCFGAAQSCTGGTMPEMVAVVVDRSGSMKGIGAKTPDIIQKQTVCRATMANLFSAEKRVAACTAAKTWQKINTSNNNGAYLEVLLDRWEKNRDPVQYGSEYVYTQLLAEADSFTRQALAEQEQIMVGALLNPSNVNILKRALTNKQDCYPKFYNPLTKKNEVPVRDDYYGSCAPVYATYEELLASKYDKLPLRSCQSSCPGECITDAVTREPAFKADPVAGKLYPTSANKPVKTTSDRMITVDSFMHSNLIANLPTGLQFYYLQFFDNNIQTDKAIDLFLGDSPNSIIPNTVRTDMDKAYWHQKISSALQENIGGMDGKASGLTPLYETVDSALDKMRAKVLDNKSNPKLGPNAPAVLIVLTDGDDNGPESKYFGRNVCTPEVPAEKYQCKKKDGKRCCHNVGFFCTNYCDNFKTEDIDQNEVQRLFGIDTPGTRKQFCKSKGFDESYEKIEKAGAAKQQVDSLVGIIGRNYPNTKIYYLDIGEGTKISKDCNNTDSVYYPSSNDLMRRRILNIFQYGNSAGDELFKAFNSALGGTEGGTPPEIARMVCELKYGADLPVNLDIPAGTAVETLNNAVQLLPSCEGATYLDVSASENTQVIPPNYIPYPIVPPNPYADPNNSDCTYGYNHYTMRPCETSQ